MEINVPVIGRPQYVNYWSGKDWTDPKTKKVKRLPDTISIKGTWDVSADTLSFINVDVVSDLMEMGMIEDNGTNEWGNPDYRVIKDDPIRIVHKKEGDNWFWVVEWVNGATAQTKQAQEVVRLVDTGAGLVPKATNDRHTFAEMRDLLSACLKTADQAWTNAGLGTPDNATLQASAATLFIQANRQGLKLTEDGPPPHTDDDGPGY